MNELYKKCKSDVAKKYGLGKTLVVGHLPKYYEEAAMLYAEQVKSVDLAARLCSRAVNRERNFQKHITMNEAPTLTRPETKAWSIANVVARFFRCWFEREPYSFTPRLGFVLFPTQLFSQRFKHLLSLNMYGFRKHKELYPYRNKMLIEFEILYMNFCFRIGIQNKTWLYVQWVESAIWWHRFKRKCLKCSGDGLPF